MNELGNILEEEPIEVDFIIDETNPIETDMDVPCCDPISMDADIPEGTSDHNKLRNRDLPNQHPISAITDLQQVLDSKVENAFKIITLGD